jgi:hypothetical protein
LWGALQQQQDVTLWRDLLYNNGLNNILDIYTPGSTVFVPVDSGLFSCSGATGSGCGNQLRIWYSLLTNSSGVGIIMSHWAPGNYFFSTLPVSTLQEVNGTVGGSRPTLLTLALNQQKLESGDTSVTNNASELLYGSTGEYTYITLNNTTFKTQFNGAQFTNYSKILRAIPTCEGEYLYIIDRPMIPENVPQSSVNDVPLLKDFCWDSALQALVEGGQWNLAFSVTALAWRELLQNFSNPRLNMTLLAVDDGGLVRLSNSYFGQLLVNDPAKLRLKWPGMTYSHMLKGGYCPSYIAGRTLKAFLGDIMNEEYTYTFKFVGNDTSKASHSFVYTSDITFYACMRTECPLLICFDLISLSCCAVKCDITNRSGRDGIVCAIGVLLPVI